MEKVGLLCDPAVTMKLSADPHPGANVHVAEVSVFEHPVAVNWTPTLFVYVIVTEPDGPKLVPPTV